jgi:hypothetical protein
VVSGASVKAEQRRARRKRRTAAIQLVGVAAAAVLLFRFGPPALPQFSEKLTGVMGMGTRSELARTPLPAHLGKRATRALTKAGVDDLADVALSGETELMAIPQVRAGTVRVLRVALAEHDVELPD